MQLFEGLPVALTVWRLGRERKVEDLELLQANRAAEVLVGRPLIARVGEVCRKLLPGLSCSHLQQVLDQVAGEEAARDLGEITYRDGQGAERALLLYAYSLADEQVALCFTEAYSGSGFVSLSSEGELDRRVVERSEQLRRAQRLEILGQLSGGVAHDFNNLITVILGCTELLEDGGEVAPAARGDLVQIRQAAERGAALTRQLLAFSRQQAMDLAVVELDRVIGEIGAMLGRVLGDHVELSIGPGCGRARVLADRGQLEQVLMNLAVNARDAMEDGGGLTIRTGAEELDEEYVREHPGCRPGPHLVVTVSDTGRGMSREVQARIFEPFYTTRGDSGGTGLGLATVFGIVRQMGGYIWVYSEPGEGSTFKVYLPRYLGEEATVQGKVEDGREEGTETLLVVEDDEGLRDIARRSLTRRGYRVLLAERDEDARRVFEEHAEEIAGLVVDVNLPGLSGPKLVQELRSVAPHLRILFVSGFVDTAVFPGGSPPPGTRFLQKPYRVSALAREVRRLLDG